VTSRYAHVLDEIDAHCYELGVLNDSEALNLLAKNAEVITVNMPDEAQGILNACGNLPLALAMIGVMVRGKPQSYWQDALDALQEADLEAIAAKFPDYPYPSLFASMNVSIDALDGNDLREKYYDFAIFPNKVAIPETVALTLWKPLSPRAARKILDEFVNRNLLIRDDKGALTIHDLQLAYIHKHARTITARHARLLENYNPNTASWHPIADDNYLYGNLVYHLVNAGRLDEAHHLLTHSSEWMDIKVKSPRSNASFLVDIEQVITQLVDNTPKSMIQAATLLAARMVYYERTKLYKDDMLKVMVLIDKYIEKMVKD
jgi:NB-ARC domain/APAF-1 helical domain